MITTDAGGLHRRIARACLILAVMAFAWSVLLIATGGFATTIAGITVRSHNPTRPAVAGLALFIASVWGYGPRSAWTAFVSAVQASDRWLAGRVVPSRALAFVLVWATLGWGLYRGTGIAGGADSYGYVSQAELWLRGLPIVPQPWVSEAPWPDAAWTFSPLGYQPTYDGTAIVPTYAVGLPMIMAAVKSVAGHAAIFWITPAAAAILVLVGYAAGRRLDSQALGLITAWLVATNATLLWEVTAPMSDVVAAAGLAGSFYLLLDSRRIPIAAGAAAALGVAVRPNLVWTVAVMAIWTAFRHRPSQDRTRVRQLSHALLFLLVLSPGVLIPAWANWRLFGSPFVSGYGDLAAIYDWSHVLPNVQEYPRLLLRSRSLPVLVGLALLLLPLKRLWPRLADRSALRGMSLFAFSVMAQYLAYEVATNEGYLRFLLPCAPFAMAASGRLLLAVSRPGWTSALVTIVLVVQGLTSARLAAQYDPLSERRYAAAGDIVRIHTEQGSVIYSFHHSGSLRYYGGRMTVRYDLLDPAWLDRSIAWFTQRGTHVYAVLDEGEVASFHERFAGQQRLEQLKGPLVLYRGPVVVHVYDLVRPPSGRARAKEWIEQFDGPRYPLPSGPPGLPWSE
jgi:hypothetical protein